MTSSDGEVSEGASLGWVYKGLVEVIDGGVLWAARAG